MATLIARIDLIQGSIEAAVDVDEALEGYALDLVRAREPVRDWDGSGDEVLTYGLGADRRRLVVSGSSARYALPPNLGSFDLSSALRAVVRWPDGQTVTVLDGRTSGLQSVGANLLGGLCTWSLTVVGQIWSGWDPVEGRWVLPDQAIYLAADRSWSMTQRTTNGQTRWVNQVTAIIGLLDLIAEALAAGPQREIALHVRTYSGVTTPSDFEALEVTADDLDDCRAWLEAQAPDPVTGTHWSEGAGDAVAFFTAAGMSTKTAVLMTDGQAGLSDLAAAIAAWGAVPAPVYVMQIDYVDTQYSLQIDTTPNDGVPILSGGDPSAMLATLRPALWGVG